MIHLLIGYMWLFIHRPFEIWPVMGTLRLERVYILTCVVYWLLFYPGKTWVQNRLNMAFVLFWIAFLLSFLFSPYRDIEKVSKTFEDYLKIIVFFVLVMGSVRDEKQFRMLVTGYLVVVGLYMTHSLWEFHNGRHVYRMGIPRMIGVDETYRDPNTFAATILYSLPLTIPFWLTARGRLARLLLLYYTALSVVCIVNTGSRSGLAGLGAFGLLCAPRLLLRRKMILLVLIAALPLGWRAIPPGLQDRFYTLIDPSVGPENAQQSAEGRKQGLLDGIQLWECSPIFGFGPSAHGYAMGHGFQAHNLYGQVLGETGTLGALALLGMVGCYVANALEARRLRLLVGRGDDGFAAAVATSVLLTVILMLVKGYGDHNLYRYTWLWFGAFQSMALLILHQRVACIAADRRRAAHSPGSHPLRITTLTGAAGVAAP